MVSFGEIESSCLLQFRIFASGRRFMRNNQYKAFVFPHRNFIFWHHAESLFIIHTKLLIYIIVKQTFEDFEPVF